MTALVSSSLLNHRAVRRPSLQRKRATAQKHGFFCLRGSYLRGDSIGSSSSTRRMHITQFMVYPVRVVAVEVAKEAYSTKRSDGMYLGLKYSVEMGSRRSTTWPRENKADNLELHNPLLRHEQMGCGWLAAIFELEGVIIEDNSDVNRRAWVALSQEEGKPPPLALTLRKIEGMKNEQAISEVLCWSRDPLELSRLSRRKEEIYLSGLGGIFQLRSGSREFMAALINYRIPTALVSTQSRKTLEMAVETIGFEGKFRVIVAAEDVCRGKPNPDMFIYASQLLGLVPERCIVFGNSNSTIEAAHDAHMKCVAVASKHPVFELGAADMVVHRLDEISFVDLKRLIETDA